DGHICAVIFTGKHCREFLGIAGKGAEKPKHANLSTYAGSMGDIGLLREELAAIFVTRSTAEWDTLLSAADIPNTPLRTLQELVHDPHLAATGFFTTSAHPSEGEVVSMRAPSLSTPE